MGGCGCKKKNVINNLNSPVHIQEAKTSFELLNQKDMSEFDDFDILEVNRIYLSLYPNAKGMASVDSMMKDIKSAIQIYGTKYRIP